MFINFKKPQISVPAIIMILSVLLMLTSCSTAAEFIIGGNDKTVSIDNLRDSFSIKLSEKDSDEFISHINDSKLAAIDYQDIEYSDFSEMDCIFLNEDSVVYSVKQSKSDSSLFCIATYEEDIEDNKPAAYMFTSAQLAEFISRLEDSAMPIDGYIGKVMTVDEDNDGIILTSQDGKQEINLYGAWNFHSIKSSGSDDPNSDMLDYSENSPTLGKVIFLAGDGTGQMILAYTSSDPYYETITWAFLADKGNKTGIVYGNSGYRYILRFIGLNDGNPQFEMIEATGADDIYGERFIRTAELEIASDGCGLEN